MTFSIERCLFFVANDLDKTQVGCKRDLFSAIAALEEGGTFNKSLTFQSNLHLNFVWRTHGICSSQRRPKKATSN
jgi:hypothetical protein